MDGATGGNASLNRRANLPTRIVPDRPAQQAKQILWETIAAQGKTNEPLQEQQIKRTIKQAEQRRENDKQNNKTTAQKKRKRTQEKEPRRKKEEKKKKRKREAIRKDRLRNIAENEIRHRPSLSGSGGRGDYPRGTTAWSPRRRRRRKMQQLGTRTNRNSEERTEIIVQGDVEYSGDAHLFIGKDNRDQMFERLGNYDISAETR